MFDLIDETVCRAVGSIVYDIWGTVGFGVEYEVNEDGGEIQLTVWDKSYKCDDKEVVVSKTFKYDMGSDLRKATHDIIAMIEKYLLENYS